MLQMRQGNYNRWIGLVALLFFLAGRAHAIQIASTEPAPFGVFENMGDFPTLIYGLLWIALFIRIHQCRSEIRATLTSRGTG